MRTACLSVLLSFFSLQTLAATSITSQVHEIDYGSRMDDDVLVFLTSGDVARLQRSELATIENLRESKSKDQWFTFSLDDDRYIKDVTSESEIPVSIEKSFSELVADYTPTTVASMKTATDYIREGRAEREGVTQCFNRAMVWSYEWWKKHSLRSMKVFIFWPKEYVRRNSFKWWFHVAPYVHVMDADGKVKERVLDVKWISKPYAFQDWADYHSSPDVKCRVVEKYSDYADNPFFSDRCYFIRANMYTWQPADLEMKEAWGYSKEAFNMDEVRAAYLEAFGIEL